MKYFKWKIKKEHWILNEFKEFLERIEEIEEINKIIPWRINRKQSWSSLKKISFAYFTISWLKLNLKKGSTAQEVFIVCHKKYKETVKEKILKLT